LRPQSLDFTEIATGTEVSRCAPNEDHLDRLVRSERQDRALEFDTQFDVDGVHLLRAIEGYPTDPGGGVDRHRRWISHG